MWNKEFEKRLSRIPTATIALLLLVTIVLWKLDPFNKSHDLLYNQIVYLLMSISFIFALYLTFNCRAFKNELVVVYEAGKECEPKYYRVDESVMFFSINSMYETYPLYGKFCLELSKDFESAFSFDFMTFNIKYNIKDVLIFKSKGKSFDEIDNLLINEMTLTFKSLEKREVIQPEAIFVLLKANLIKNLEVFGLSLVSFEGKSNK